MTNISTIASAQQSLGLRQIVARQNKEADRLSTEVATGMKQDVYAENAGAATRSLTMRSRMAANQAFMEGNTVLQGRLDSMSDALTAIAEQARSFQSLSLTGSIASDNRGAYRLQAQHTLEQVANLLNSTYSGDYLFSGLATDRKAVEIQDASASGLQVAYTGGAAGLGAKIDEDTTLAYGLSAADSSFGQIFDAVTQVLNADLDSLSLDAFQALRASVTSTLNAGLEGLTSRQARLGNQQTQLQDKIDAQQALRSLYHRTVTDIEGVDVAETAVRLQNMQVQLKATYEVTSRLEQMSLLDYL